MLAVILGSCQYNRGVPSVHPSALIASHEQKATAADPIPWPSKGQAAFAIEGLPTQLGPGATGAPVPIASVTKIMTALLILEHHPLTNGASGPDLTLTAADEARYAEAVRQDQSVVDVRAGETISELELLQGLLLPSGNNIAEILAAWDVGSTGAFVTAMNDRAAALGMAQTHFDDVSGFSPASVSNAADLMLLAQAAMANPTFREIVSEKQATLPVAGVVTSTNELLDDPGVIGVKTGNTDEAGGCMVFAANVQVGGRSARLIGVVLGQTDLGAAFEQSRKLIAAAPAQVVTTRVINKGDEIAVYESRWGARTTAVATNDIDVVTWAGAPITVAVDLRDLTAPVAAGTEAGQVSVTTGGAPIKTSVALPEALPAPGLGWRLKRD